MFKCFSELLILQKDCINISTKKLFDLLFVVEISCLTEFKQFHRKIGVEQKGVVTTHNHVVVKPVEFFKVLQELNKPALCSSDIRSWTNLYWNVKLVDLANLIFCEVAAMAKAIRFKVYHALAFLNLFFGFSTMEGNFKAMITSSLKVRLK